MDKWRRIIIKTLILLIFISIILAILIKAQNPNQWFTNINDGILAYWTFNETNPPFADLIGANNNFTQLSSSGWVGWNATGIINNSVNFTSAQSSILNTSNTVGLSTGNGSISLWVNWTGVTLLQRYDIFSYAASADTPSTDGIPTLIIIIDDREGQECFGALLSNSSHTLWQICSNSLTLDTYQHNWTHIVLVQNGTSPILYINGQNITVTFEVSTNKSGWTDDIFNDPIEPANQLQLGQTLAIISDRFDGSIDEVGIWNRELTSNQIKDIYNKGRSNSYDTTPDLTATINFPNRSLYGKTTSSINFNITLSHNGSASFSFDAGKNNYTFNSTQFQETIFNTRLNRTNSSMIDGNYTLRIYSNNSGNNRFNYSQSFDFTLDYFAPNVTIGTITTTQGSQTVTFNSTVVDNQNLNGSCWYAIYNSSGDIDNSPSNNNASFTCNSDKQFTVTKFATFNLTVYGNDTAGNLNYTESKQFTTTESAGGGGGGGGAGGGGGGAPSVSLIPVISLKNPIGASQTYSSLQRAIFYAVINNRCSEKIKSQPLAIEDFSEKCVISPQDRDSISSKIINFLITIPGGDLLKFIEGYKNKETDQSFASQSEILKYGLFSAILGERNILQLNPPRVDRPVLIFEQTNNNHTIIQTITSNKPLSKCEVITKRENTECVLETNSTVKVSYFIPKTDFFSEVFETSIIVTTDAPSDKIEQRPVSVIFRVYNIQAVPIGIAIVSLFSLVSVFFFFLRKRKIKLKKIFDLNVRP